jgi:hypothetical protein
MIQVVAGLRVVEAWGTSSKVDDFGRDVYGAVAVDRRQTPYQQLGSIDPRLDPEFGDEWVAHSPAAIGLAVLAYSIDHDVSSAVFYGRFLGFVVFLLGVALSVYQREWWLTVGLGAALATSAFASNFYWNQHGLVIAVLVGFVLLLDNQGRRTAALVLLGLGVAVKPWLAPIAILLPRSRAAWRDLLVVGSVSGLLTVACLPVLGGFHVLMDWLSNALPANMDQWAESAGNRSVVSAFGSGWSQVVYATGLGLLPFVRSYIGRSMWPTLAWLFILTMTPLTWDHFLVDISPLLAFGALAEHHKPRLGPLGILLVSVAPTLGMVAGIPFTQVAYWGFVAAVTLGTVVIALHAYAEFRQRHRPIGRADKGGPLERAARFLEVG